MKRGIAFLGLALCLFVMNSCAGFGAIVTITAFGVEAYEEARIHRPDLKLAPISDHLQWPDIEFFSEQSSDQNNTKIDQNGTKTATSSASSTFGFDCSKIGDEKKQPKCFNDFSKVLAQRADKSLKSKDVLIPKKEEWLATLQKDAKTLKTLPAKAVKKTSSTHNNVINKEKKPTTSQALPASYVQNWASAWEKKDISTYLSFYSKEFKGSKNHRGAWEASRQRALKENKNISIKLSNIKVNQKGTKKVEVNFI